VSLVDTALGLVGSPYRNGGADPSGFDCSGFVHYVFAEHGIATPRQVAELYRSSVPVHEDDLAPGDLLFFSTEGRNPTHVAIAIGGDEFVHAPNSRGRVRVERLAQSYWERRFVGARRLE
jgi:cell wall-associated NlpC family hydrolase